MKKSIGLLLLAVVITIVCAITKSVALYDAAGKVKTMHDDAIASIVIIFLLGVICALQNSNTPTEKRARRSGTSVFAANHGRFRNLPVNAGTTRDFLIAEHVIGQNTSREQQKVCTKVAEPLLQVK